MFGIIVGAVVVTTGVLIAVSEMHKTTGDKIKTGDSVFVPVDRLSVGNPTDDAALKAFLGGFVSVVAKVSNVVTDTRTKLGHGSILGFGPTVTFPLDSVASIDRNGTRIV